MIKPATVAAALILLPLAACNERPADKLADRVEDAGDARADALENEAEMLENRADAVRDNADDRSDAIEAADRDVSQLSGERRDAIVADEAPAVR